jgi:hypothetical protein
MKRAPDATIPVRTSTIPAYFARQSTANGSKERRNNVRKDGRVRADNLQLVVT